MADLLIDTRDRLVELVLKGDTSGARALVSRVAHVEPMSDVIEVVFAGAQLEVGNRWQNNQCSVVDEHMATSVVRSALETALSSTRWRGEKRGSVAVSCAEGDWHSLAARLQAEKLISEGWSVRFLGASSPADQVQNYLSRNSPSALVITCTYALALSGAARLANCAHAVGVPVLVGGRAVTPFQLASRLGADESPMSNCEVNEVLDRWERHTPTTMNVTGRRRAELTNLEINKIVNVATAVLASRIPTLDERAHEAARTPEVLSFIVRAAGASAFVDSPMVFNELLLWLEQVETARGGSKELIDVGVSVLCDVVDMTKGEHNEDMSALASILHS
jgi:methanogenic corrinoid protein MtbC1